MRALFLKFDAKIGVLTLFSYAVVGGLSAAFNFLLFALFWDVLHLYYKIAVTIAYVLTIHFNFCCNRFFTFKCNGKTGLPRHMYRYVTMILINYAITMTCVHGAVKWFSLSPYYGLVTSLVLTAFTGFGLSKFWVYTK